MAKKKTEEITIVNLRGSVLKGPKLTIQQITQNAQNVRFTRVIQTYIMETQDLKLGLFKDNKVIYSGTVKWIGNRPDSAEGTVFCVENKDELKILSPTKSNSSDIEYVPEKGQIKIKALSTTNCGICGKGIEIFDEESTCPLCESSFHKDHILEYVNKKSECYTCKKPLSNNNGVLVPKD